MPGNYVCFTLPKDPTFDIVVPVGKDVKGNYAASLSGGSGHYAASLSGGSPPRAPQGYASSLSDAKASSPSIDVKTLIEEGFHHSSFLSGGEVTCAGEIKCKDGKLELISNVSGHYRPPEDFLRQVFMELEDHGFDFGQTTVDMELANHGDAKSTIKKVNKSMLMTFKKELLNKGKSRSYKPDQKNVEETYANEGVKSATVGKKVRYLKPDELKKCEVKVEKNVLRLDGRPLNTYGGLIYGQQLIRDRFIFVMDAEGHIYAADVIKMMKFKPGQETETFKKDLFARAITARG